MDNNFDDMESKNLLEELEEILGSSPIEIDSEYNEKLKVVSAMEKKYTKTFGDIINNDEEYSLMSLDEKIQTIQECLNTNKPKNIILGDWRLSEEMNQKIMCCLKKLREKYYSD
ncbi:MAG: hypothetical protein HDT22_03615 [Ruminococcus sp.]|nr:hypothetical protein [Ruminococcus sp.]